MEARAAAGQDVQTSEHGLKAGAISFWEGLVVALASTAPAYSLAAVIGSIAVAVGFYAPAALLIAFVPMFFIAAAFYWLNKADQDCGTTFSWVTRAMGPNTGWIAGWAVAMTGILVVGSLADVAVFTFYDLIGADGLQSSKAAIIIGAVLLIAAMTTVCVIGTEASARMQMVLMAIQIIPLLIFIGVILWKVFSGDGPASSFEPNLSWFNPLNIEAGNLNPFSSESGGLIQAMLLGIFIYWGWESAVNLNEETSGDVTRPGLAGLISTIILLITYVGVATAVLAWHGLGGAAAFDDKPGILAKYAEGALGSPLAEIVLLAVVVSALASTQTTILPASRTALSMARHEAIPSAFGEVSKRFFTPVFATIAIGVLATAWYVPGKLINKTFLFDSLTALGLMIAFYYALTGFACVIYYRREIPKTWRNLLFVGLAPGAGALVLTYIFVKALFNFSDPENSYTAEEWFGVAPPAVIGVGMLLVGVVLLFAWRLYKREPFFKRRTEVADPALLERGPPAEPAVAGGSK
ncbi:MAG TPA: APC family permease [Solirubrobacterales bacterium]|nr:APC family permease [Solirubrobacterales bacterium]